MSEYENRITRVIVGKSGEPIFSEMATTVEIDDESAGEFVTVSQHVGPGLGKIAIERVEWPAIRAAIDEMMERCRP